MLNLHAYFSNAPTVGNKSRSCSHKPHKHALALPHSPPPAPPSDWMNLGTACNATGHINCLCVWISHLLLEQWFGCDYSFDVIIWWLHVMENRSLFFYFFFFLHMLVHSCDANKLHVNHCLDFFFVFSALLCAWRNLFSASRILWPAASTNSAIRRKKPDYRPFCDFQRVPRAYRPRAQISNHRRACTDALLLH